MIKVYGLKVSYFTGKLEGYLRYKEIPYEFRAMTAREFERLIPEKTGAMQMPAVELPDGRWITDTSPIIDWLETRHPAPPILPPDPVAAFACRLIEDYADEWLWRPAMHFRWSNAADARLLSHQIAEAMGRDNPAPAFLKRFLVARRQRYNFVVNDSVNAVTRGHVEQTYRTALSLLENILDKRPYILGDRPTLADIGLFGPMFRHFSMDPTPAAIMRETSPAVMAWVYRLWNARAARLEGASDVTFPDDLGSLLREIADTHLVSLAANAEAWAVGGARHDFVVQGVNYRNIPTSRYRVWCLEKLQRHFRSLDDEKRARFVALIEKTDGIRTLTAPLRKPSDYDAGNSAPFAPALPVFEKIRR